MKPAIALIGTYVVITAILQCVSLLVGWLIDSIDPTIGLLAFVVLFLAMFWVGWPIAVRLSGTWFPDKSHP